MKKMRKWVGHNEKSGFTLVEIIVVLVVIAIMAAVAIPKFLSIADDAKLGMAQAGLNEAKASLTVAYSKAYLSQGGNPTIDSVYTNVFTTSPLNFGDIPVSATAPAPGATNISLSATYQTQTKNDIWNMPAQ